MAEDKKVAAIIVGAGRTGTTTVANYLAAHQEVSFSITKEVHFFSLDDKYAQGAAAYHAMFPKSDRIWVGADTYLWIDERAPKRLKAYNPDLKIIIGIREPVSRTISSYKYAINNGHAAQTESLEESLRLERERNKTLNLVDRNNLCHAEQGLYEKYLKLWLKHFPIDQLFIFETTELANHPNQLAERLSIFLGLKTAGPTHALTEKKNASMAVKSKQLQQVLLNRESIFRTLIRKLLPRFIKNMIIQSGAVDQVATMNKTEAKEIVISPEEKELLSSYFDLPNRLLEEEFGIKF